MLKLSCYFSQKGNFKKVIKRGRETKLRENQLIYGKSHQKSAVPVGYSVT